MDFAAFQRSLSETTPPVGIDDPLLSLWLQANDQWELAHDQVRDNSDQASAWVHAFLHRVEGDMWNADYWYGRASKKRPSYPLEDEWQRIAQALLS